MLRNMFKKTYTKIDTKYKPQAGSDHAGKVPFAPAIVCAAVVAVIATTLL